MSVDAGSSSRLSVVIAIISDTGESRIDTTFLRRCLKALHNQVNASVLEIIVPYHQRVQDVGQLKVEFPRVEFLDTTGLISPLVRYGKEHHQEMRALGISRAQGEIVGLLEDVGEPNHNWCAEAISAHRSDYAAIGGAIENGDDRLLNWAIYFCDFARYHNPVPAGPTNTVSDANATYKRNALLDIREVWGKAFHEPEVNAALLARNHQLALSPDLIVYQRRGKLTLSRAVQERVVWARGYATNRSKHLNAIRRVILGALSPVLPIVIPLRIFLTVLRKGRLVGQFVRALPLIVCLAAATAFGELQGYMAPGLHTGKRYTQRG